MILPDSSVWINHLRKPLPEFERAWDEGIIVTHPYVIGEVALGSLANRRGVLKELRDIVQLPVATALEVATLIEEERLFGCGVGYGDCHLLASVRLVAGARLWTCDRRLRGQAERLGVAYSA